MPEKSGGELLADIKKIRPEVKVIFMIGYAPDVICNKLVVEEGMDSINKPFNKNELLKKIRGVLHNSHIKIAKDKTCLVGVGTI